MAKVRIGFSTNFTQFSLKDEKVGIGTSTTSADLHLTGNLIAKEYDISGGISTSTTYSGFIDETLVLSKQTIPVNKSSTFLDEIVIDGEVTVSSGATISSGPEKLTVTDSFAVPGMNDDIPTAGTLRFNENLGALEFYNGVQWNAVNSYIDMGTRGRAILAGGASPGYGSSPNIEYLTIATAGNSQDFGDLQAAKSEATGTSSSTRGIFANGYASPARLKTIDYITIAAKGNGVNFGDSTHARNSCDAGCSSSTRSVMAGGYSYNNSPANEQNVIDYLQIATTGSCLDFGDLPAGRNGMGACSNSTRGLFGGGGADPWSANTQNMKDIYMVTIASKAKAQEFADLAAGAAYIASCGNSVRGIWSGGYHGNSSAGIKTIQYITLASTGNAIDFGERLRGGAYTSATASQTRYVMVGVRDAIGHEQQSEHIEIASGGNAIFFGELGFSTHAIGSCSDSHGGLGGF